MKSLGLLILFLLVADINAIYAQDGRVYNCATSEDIYEALDAAKPGDKIILQGGKVYEINKSLTLKANGTERSRITFTSKDNEGLGRYAVLSTVGGKKEEKLVAVYIRGSFWNISRIEIAGKKIPLNNNYWDIHGFRIGLYFTGAASQYNIVEDVHIHHTHNTAVAIRDESHDNTFRRIKIHHIGEWLDADYNAHEAEGFYIGSSKGLKEGGNKARAYNIVIEDSVIGPGVLGQYFDLKYATSYITVRNNILYCDEKTYNAEIIKLAGFASIIKDNIFIGTNDNLIQYIKVDCQKKEDPVLVDYLGEKDVPPPSGKDNTITNNVFSTTDQTIIHVKETGCDNSPNNDLSGGEVFGALAFPGAEGFGAYAEGGRGGDVYIVTNTEDSGPGSLREGIASAVGPRTIVFAVSGLIQLQSKLKIDKDYITIAGQTAPGDGICFRDYTFQINANHIIVRYIRSRLGTFANQESDAISITEGSNIIIDHCSASWSVDETLSSNGDTVDLLTVQWCMVTESLTNSIHTKGRHGYGGIIGALRQSYHHNLFAHHSSRNPKVTWRRYCQVDFRNNVVYNWGFNSHYDGSVAHMNWVNNYYKYGPATKASVQDRIFEIHDNNSAPEASTYEAQMYAEGNYVWGFPGVTADNWSGGIDYKTGANESKNRVFSAFSYPAITKQSAQAAYDLVLPYAGASLVRDSIDTRIVGEVIAQTSTYGNNGLIDITAEVGGWPEYATYGVLTDSDKDGMSDVWELAQVPPLDPADPSDRNNYDFSADYTNLEVYINSIISDSDPPLPNPATFASVPTVAGDTSISMTATTGSDTSTSGPVEYYFTETTGNPGGTDSGWQTSPAYTDTGLSFGTQYTYTVMMRDSVLPTPNIGSASVGASATTVTAPNANVVDGLGFSPDDSAYKDVVNPFNEYILDLITITGPLVTFRADPDQIARATYVDENDDIVQVDFFGSGTCTVIIDPNTFSDPEAPVKYFFEGVKYVKGRARIIIEGADTDTYSAIFTLGSLSAEDPEVILEGTEYDGIADVTSVTVTGTAMGGMIYGNVRFSGSEGDIGILAEGVPVLQQLSVFDIKATGTAVPHLLVGQGSALLNEDELLVQLGVPVGALGLAGGDLQQTNSAGIRVADTESTAGFGSYQTRENFKSDGTPLPAVPLVGTFENALSEVIVVPEQQ